MTDDKYAGLDIEVDDVELEGGLGATLLDETSEEVRQEELTQVQTIADPTIIGVPQVATRAKRKKKRAGVFNNGTVAAAVMVFAAIAAVIVANSPIYESVLEVIETPIGFGIGHASFSMSIETFVNDFLMAIFFLLVGIELKYEMTVGQLKHIRQAALPMLAAVGGVAVPALIYILINMGGAVHGWAIPIATDIAFALGVMSLLGDRISPATKVFFSTLAIADDILAIIVIAVAYGQAPDIMWCAAAVGVVLMLYCMNKAHIYNSRPYIVVGLLLWICMYKSGIHATLSGVILALFLPVKSDIKLSAVSDWMVSQSKQLDDYYEDEEHVLGQHHFTNQAHSIERIMRHVTPPLQRFENAIAVPVNFIILPLFAFVNAQVRLVGVDPSIIVSDPVTQGAYFGAVLGKPLGIILVTYLLVKINFAKLPEGVNWNQIIAVGLMGGLGFTMSILIAGLAFGDPSHVLSAKCAILAGSITSSLLGIIWVKLKCKQTSE